MTSYFDNSAQVREVLYKTHNEHQKVLKNYNDINEKYKNLKESYEEENLKNINLLDETDYQKHTINKLKNEIYNLIYALKDEKLKHKKMNKKYDELLKQHQTLSYNFKSFQLENTLQLNDFNRKSQVEYENKNLNSQIKHLNKKNYQYDVSNNILTVENDHLKQEIYSLNQQINNLQKLNIKLQNYDQYKSYKKLNDTLKIKELNYKKQIKKLEIKNKNLKHQLHVKEQMIHKINKELQIRSSKLIKEKKGIKWKMIILHYN